MTTDTSIQTLPSPPRAIRPLTTEQSRALTRRFPHLSSDLSRCVTCRGAGEFTWYSPTSQRKSTARYACPCADQFIAHRVLLYSGVATVYQRLGWVDFAHMTSEVHRVAVDYLDYADAYISQGFGLILHGARGTGKSLLANLLLKTLVTKDHDCYATTFAQMIDHFAEGWRSREDRQWFDSRVRNCHVLLVDDLGRERNKGVNSVGENMLEEVIRHRVAHAMPTFITTNLSVEQVRQGYGGYTMSLLTERHFSCEFIGGDRRQEMNDRFTREVKSGLTRPIVWA